MTAADLLARRTQPLALVIFDCDGVIADSEPIANRIVAEELTVLGWAMSAAESHALFLGMTITDMVPLIETRLGRPVPPGWREGLIARLRRDIVAGLDPVPGAVETLHALAAAGLPFRVASNSSHQELEAKFARLGIAALVAGRVHSHHDVARGKPAPDLFLAAAAAEGAAAPQCVVIEDSVIGVRAATAAGMDCLAYVPSGAHQAHRAAGAAPFAAMHGLAPLLLAAAGRGA